MPQALNAVVELEQIENLTGSPAGAMVMRIKDADGKVIASQSVPSGPDAAFPPMSISLPAGDYTVEAQTMNAATNWLAPAAKSTFTVAPMFAWVPKAISVSVG